MRLSHLRRAAVLTLVAATMATSSACFGSFNATRKLWMFNRDVSKNKFAQEVVFLAMNIVPVYGVGAFLDAVVFNTVEFWSGKNPIEMASRTQIDGRHVVETVVTEKNGDRKLVIKGYESGNLSWTTTMSAAPGTDRMEFKTVFANGRVVDRVVGVDQSGSPYLVSSHDSP